MQKNRNYAFTWNNYTTDVVNYLTSLECRYIVYGKEVGDQGTPHLQGTIVFKHPVTWEIARQRLLGSSVTPLRKSLQTNINYCKKGIQSKEEWNLSHEKGPNYGKDADVYERGHKPMSQQEKGEKGKEYWQDVLDTIEDGHSEDLDPHLRFVHAKTIDFIENKFSQKRQYEDTTQQHLWYYGETGTGKSRKAREENPDAYLKMCNKWWDGYKGEEVVIIEDFDIQHSVLCHHMKIWGDRYPFMAEVKGGSRKIRPGKIVVTSNYHPRDIWQSKSDFEPITRRFKIIEFKSLQKKNI